jgi:monoterpene epsilon-lactone hydrolase
MSEPADTMSCPSWQARCLVIAVRMLMRRRDWGDERALTRRARRVFGAPRLLQWLRTRAVAIEPVHDERVRGEWIVPERSAHGIILYLHGGGYVAGSAATDRPLTAALARLARRRVFSLDDRLAPEHRFPAALDDATGAYRWLLDTGVRPSALTLAGTSAGGGLALSTLLRIRDEGLPLPACTACFSPWTDLSGSGPSVQSNDGRCAILRAANIVAFARIYLGGCSPRTPYASPVFGDFAGLPPVLLQVASTELLLDDACQVHDKIQRAGGASKLEIVHGVFHAWHMLDGVLPEARAALHRAAAFLNAPAAHTARG